MQVGQAVGAGEWSGTDRLICAYLLVSSHLAYLVIPPDTVCWLASPWCWIVWQFCPETFQIVYRSQFCGKG